MTIFFNVGGHQQFSFLALPMKMIAIINLTELQSALHLSLIQFKNIKMLGVLGRKGTTFSVSSRDSCIQSDIHNSDHCLKKYK